MFYHFRLRNLILPVSSQIKHVSTRLHITITYFDIIFIDPSYVLLPPCSRDSIPHSLIQKVMLCLATRFDLATKDISAHLQTASLKQYGKVQHIDGRDVMNTSSIVAMGDDHWDATFGARDTEPLIRMDSIRSPPGVHQESTWSPSGVHLESIRSPSGVHQDLSQGSSHCNPSKNPGGLLMDSWWSPSGWGLFQDSWSNPLTPEQD